jgi:hypothetical protein
VPTPTSCCRRCCASTGSGPRRGVRHRAGSPARSAGRAPTTRSSPPALTGRWRRSRPRCSTRCGSAPTSCSPCGCPTTRRSAPPSTWSAPGRPGARRLRQRRAPQGGRRDLDEWIAAGRARPETDRPSPTRPATVVDRLATPAGWSTSSAGGGGRARRAARRRQRRAAGHPGRPSGALHPSTSCRQASRPATRRTASCWTVATLGVPAVAEGRAGVQDEGSQLVALALPRPRSTAATSSGSTCAPGRAARPPCSPRSRPARRAVLSPTSGSTTGPGWWPRLAGCRRRAPGCGHRRRHAPAWAPGTFDRVLVDAPCSGLGALRRRPEARWRKTARDRRAGAVPAGAAGQCAGLGAPRGVVVYATCSPVLAETTGVVDAVVASRTDVQVERSEQLWPHRDNTDAMFLAVIRRS